MDVKSSGEYPTMEKWRQKANCKLEAKRDMEKARMIIFLGSNKERAIFVIEDDNGRGVRRWLYIYTHDYSMQLHIYIHIYIYGYYLYDLAFK